MVQTRHNTEGSSNPADPVAEQLAAIASKLEAMDSLQADMAALKRQVAGKDKAPFGGGRFDEAESGFSNAARRPFHKIDFPSFSGGDPRGWILKAEKYFRFYNTLDEEKVDVAAIHLEGDALDFYSWISTEQDITYWEELTAALQKHFGPPEFQNPDEYLCSVKQTGTIMEYRQEFTRRSSRVNNWPDHCLLGVFLNGLKDELKADVRIHKPRTVYKAVSLAMEFESKLNSSKPERKTSYQSQLRPDSKPFIPSTNYPSTAPVTKMDSKPNPRLTDAEKQARYLKGECFKCGAKYGPGHRCQTGTLKLLAAGDDEPEDVEEEPNDMPEETAEISLNAILGRPHPTTMKVHGTLNNTEVLILVDGGSTHNFISEVLVSELHLCTQPIEPFGVQIGNGDVIRCGRICKSLSIKVEDLSITQDFHPFSLGGADVVLGVQWLATLNTVQANWKEMFMIFTIEGKKYKFQGIASGPQKSSSFQHLAIEPDSAPIIPALLKPLLETHTTVFLEPNTLPPVRTQTHSINLFPNSTPPNIRPYRYPHIQKNEIEKQVQQLLDLGFIQPSTSPFSSPILLVRKKDQSWRMCVDYRALNKITIADKYPIPNIDELLDELYGATIFSKLDLRSGYYQIRVTETDVPKTAFRTHSGHYEFKVMPFGLTNAPSTFQAIMNDLFRPFLRKFVLVFFDDILIYSRDMDQHVYHLDTTLQLLQSHSFFVKLSKCCFGQSHVNFLGHIITSEGVKVEEEKIAAVKSWPIPQNVTQVRGFLGLTGYYRRFVRNYGIIARPLTALTKKNGFHWNDEAWSAFNALKTALTTAPVLHLPDFDKEFVVECDASSDGVGAILSQAEHPIAYFSKGFTPSTRFKSAYDRELLALVLAVQKWNHYLFGRHFLIRTDHYTLKFLLEQRVTTTEQQRLLLKLMPYDFSILHRAGKENRGADALSRRPMCATLLTLTVPFCVDVGDIREGLQTDPFTLDLLNKLQNSSTTLPDFSLADGFLFYRKRLVIPDVPGLRMKLLQEAHDTPIGGHGGFLKTLKRLSSQYFWPQMNKDIRLHVQNCITCQQQKYQTTSPAGLLQPLPIPNQIWEDVSMDFIVGLPPSNRFDTILVVIDRLSKYAHFLSLAHPFTAKTVANLFCKEIVRLHGFPRSIVSDRDVVFLSHFWQELFRLSHTKLNLSSSYHPQTDGQSEVSL
ncbi:hypothetical protein E3N88_07946 [Mikania micrantha]|uniref:Reverse transcriptase n=1 Tax=Mikania micrantha TaxID=192012 RepID=A0A5N6PGV0_9ASTR|nr:hypothetical protein E3N88_07946 [Mikania micrantha]